MEEAEQQALPEEVPPKTDELPSDTRVCHGHILRHLTEQDIYIMVTDLISEDTVEAWGSCLDYDFPLEPNDGVKLLYSIDEDLEEGGEVCPIVVHKILPVIMKGIGLVTECGADHFIVDYDHYLPKSLLISSTGLPITEQSALEYEAVETAKGPTRYRCLWAHPIDPLHEVQLYERQHEQQLLLSSAKARQCSVYIVEQDQVFPVNSDTPEADQNALWTRIFRVRNLCRRNEAKICKIHILKAYADDDTYFTLVSPEVHPHYGVDIGCESEVKISILARPAATTGIFQQTLVVEMRDFKILRTLKLVCGDKAHIRKYTIEYDGNAKQQNPELMLANILYMRCAKRKDPEQENGPQPPKKRKKNRNHWEIPTDIRFLLKHNKWKPLIKKQFPFVYEPLSDTNYEKKLHHCIYLDELELFRHFQQHNLINYKLRVLNKDKNTTLIDTPNLQETQPTLMMYDTVAFTESPSTKYKSRSYGSIIELLQDEVVVQMQDPINEERNYDVCFYYSRNTMKDHHHALEKIRKCHLFQCLFPQKESLQGGPATPFIDVEIASNGRLQIGTGYNKKWLPLTRNDFDASQIRVLRNILRGELRALPYLIRGPPGTGKTTTLVEIILQLYLNVRTTSILICTQSNTAADLMLAKLVASKLVAATDLLRLVGPSRTKTSQEYEDYIVMMPDELMQIVPKRIATKELLMANRIIITTTGLVSRLSIMEVSKNKFTHLIVDEAGQCSETEMLPALTMMGNKNCQMILAGDDKQLGPVVLCEDLQESGFEESCFERLMKFPLYDNTSGECNPTLSNQLNYNYRSLPSILGLFNGLFYNSQLRAMVMEGKNFETLKNLHRFLPQNSKRNEATGVLFYHVLGTQQRTASSPSWINPMEANVVAKVVIAVLKGGVKPDEIGIITPYKGQVALIREQVGTRKLGKIMVGSVEQFQGQEKPVIILSVVRSSEIQYEYCDHVNLGFVNSPKRANVAFSRAQSLLVIVGNPIVLRQDPMWAKVVEYCTSRYADVITEARLLSLLGGDTTAVDFTSKINKFVDAKNKKSNKP